MYASRPLFPNTHQPALLSAWRAQISTTGNPRLQQHLTQQEQTLLPRFAAYYDHLHHLPRRLRRALQRQWKRSLAGVALLMILGQTPALAATINVGGNGCTLVNAITAANTDNAIGGCTAGSGTDTIVLPAGSIQSLGAVNNTAYGGATGLPIIESIIIIEGNGSTIQRSSTAPDFRILAVNSLGNLSLRRTTISGGHSAGIGGGVYNVGGSVTLTNSTVSGNSTSGEFFGGGGVFNFGTLTLTNSTVSGNSTSGNLASGGGVYNFEGSVTLTNSTISGNSTSGYYSHGGGVFNYSGNVTFTNSTLSGNSTSRSDSNGGGVYNRSNASFTNSTISRNSTGYFAYGSGVFNASSGTLTLARTLISGNTNANSFAEEVANYGSVSTNGFSLFGHSGQTTAQALFNVPLAASDITATSDGEQPRALAAILNTTLANNGGATRTHALPVGSPAVNAITTGCPPPSTDQRGVSRPQGGRCDIGAFELTAAPPPATCGGVTITIFGTTGNDTITGTAGVDVIQGREGNDTINGLGGNDILCGGPGNDNLNGALGNDRLLGEAGVDTAQFFGNVGVNVNLTTGTATGLGSDTLSTIENVLGTAANDILIGNGLINVLNGAGGNDLLTGAGGNDSLIGGTGSDTAQFFGNVGITANLTTGSATGLGSDTLSTIENLTGGNVVDTLTGNAAANVLNGGAGNDRLSGLGGNDTLNGGDGNDAMNGGTQTDTCNGQAGTGDTATACETVSGVP